MKTWYYALIAIIGSIVLAILLAFPIKWLWNWLMPQIFALPRITVIQGWGLSFLISLLFKSGIKFKNNE